MQNLYIMIRRKIGNTQRLKELTFGDLNTVFYLDRLTRNMYYSQAVVEK